MRSLSALLLLVCGFAFASELSGVVTIFHAGSLSVPLEIIEERFETMHPGVDVRRESAGSVACARIITELGREDCDIMASADYTVIDDMLIPDYTEWNAVFATNRMVVAYTPGSRHADEINSDNWIDILAMDEVEWGHSDPDADPCGYRTLLVLQLAEEYYGIPGFYETLLTNRDERNIRPRSVELISLLESGHLDYAFEYLSVAVQHDLQYVDLPPEINLGDPDKADMYATASTVIAGSSPGETTAVSGAPIAYGITLLSNASNSEAAVAFLEYMLSPEGGLAVLDELGQPPFVPCRLSSGTVPGSVPASLTGLVEQL
ncbi:MAG: tungstate ABC transporter substrate-binding protein WtpA [Candidatus Fermentibacteraceae bacterium]|nr:tungstate ABC transporter substrate-binding protein WtpA [Candidatus Fermentibacteraceae bacterium]MBN2609902.1 tungstate ABC transporter substrate-binding protein WtpA [Candidatus Fermentibacteraceae bacterium]